MHMQLARSAKSLAALAIGLAAAALLATVAMPKAVRAPIASAASADYYLKIDGIEGEATDAGHEKQIDIQSWSWGVTAPRDASTGQASGKIKFNDFNYTKRIDKATPALFQACATGKHFKDATLYVSRKAGGGKMDFYKVTFTDALCSSWTQQGTGDDAPTESVSFTYSKVKVEYAPKPSVGQPPVWTTTDLGALNEAAQ
jgi:type VI secretion system secreted protein Hcp